MLAAALDDCAPAALTDDGLTLAWPESSSFLKRKAEDPANKELLVGRSGRSRGPRCGSRTSCGPTASRCPR